VSGCAGEGRAVAALAAVVRRLPRRAALAAGRAIGRFWGDADRRHLAIAADHLRLAFPDWPESSVLRTASDCYGHFGAGLVDILWLQGRPREEVLRLVDVVGREHVDAAMALGRGVVLASGHIGNWEVHGLVHGWVFGPIGVVARPIDDPALDARLVAFRSSGGNTVVYKQRALGQVLRMLRAGRSVALLLDQNVAADNGVFVDFFGRPAATTTVAAALAAKTGCAIVPSYPRLLPDGRYRLTYEPAISWDPTTSRDRGIFRITQRIAHRLEQWVRESPEQWLWMHRRWKTQPRPGEATPPLFAEAASPRP
jgi:Kdo2-lipid IVA lauroyltransferase/acyltransferase